MGSALPAFGFDIYSLHLSSYSYLKLIYGSSLIFATIYFTNLKQLWIKRTLLGEIKEKHFNWVSAINCSHIPGTLTWKTRLTLSLQNDSKNFSFFEAPFLTGAIDLQITILLIYWKVNISVVIKCDSGYLSLYSHRKCNPH
jgi:hypothetical protein